MLTNTNISSLPASRELDALVAEHVMHQPIDKFALAQGVLYNIPPYSTSIAAAWEVVEKLAVVGSAVLKKENGWICVLGLETADANTAPLAICRAALKVVG